jgi:3',5'-cyclic AMP phosphodiesterase CpdA
MASASPSRSITLLHLSDLQFGKEHAFGGRARLPEDGRFDTLLQRLSDDLEGLQRDEGLVPDVVVVTGDLAEWALPAEFEAVGRFAEGLRELLDLPSERFVLLPGNHDVNRKLCHAHVLQAEARGGSAQPPYWPKWEPFVEMLARFYGEDAGVVFTEGQPYTLFEYEDLRLVIAALNSTMAESHRDEDHHGWLGETQARWFSEQLREYEARGWLRVAALHHNLFAGHVGDDELLHDREQLERWIVPRVNLVLHGHTHDGKLQWLAPDVPVLSTGSAAVLPGARSPGIPNQYQYIRLDAEGLHRWCRAYDSAHHRWMGDLTVGDGNEWRMQHPVRFASVHGTFPPQRDVDVSPASIQEEDQRPRSPEAELLQDVAEIVRAREPDAKVRVVTLGARGRSYLRVEQIAGGVAEVLPVGAVVGTVDDVALESFLDLIHRPARMRGLGSVSELVYSGAPPQASVETRARAERVRLRSFAELQGLIDFRRYVAAQTRRLVEDPSYPPASYVTQRMQQRAGRELLPHPDALASITDWVARDEGCFVLVLGDFGVGKTFLLHELARRLGEVEDGPVPILIELRALEKAATLEQLLAQHFARHDFAGYVPSRFRHMLEGGRIVLVFDGFDELVVRVTYPSAVEHFDTLVRAAQGRAKVVVTSRRQHFLTDHDVRRVLMDHVEWVPSSRVVLMSGFDREQIESFLRGRMPSEEVAPRLEQIGEIRDLMGLSENPRMLSFIAELSEAELLAARDQKGMISAAALYRQLLRRWLGHEHERRHPPGTAPGLTEAERWRAVEALAERLWRSGQPALPVEALLEQAAALDSLAQSTEEAGFQIGSGTLLVRDEIGRFSFVHQSVMEWLVASVAARTLEGEHVPAILQEAQASPLMADFLVDLATPAVSLRWAINTLNTKGASDHGRRNALLLRERAKRGLGEPVGTGAKLRELLASGGSIALAGENLQGEDVEGLDLTGADLRDAMLRGLRAVGTDLRHADLRGADLTGADLAGADLREANLRGANLTGARLKGTRVEGADLRRATLLAVHELPKLDRADVRGAALPGRPPTWYLQRPEGFVRRLSVAEQAGLVAVCTNGAVMLHELETLRRIRCYRVEGLIDAVLACDGTRLVVASGSHIQIVDVETGTILDRVEVGSPARLAVDPTGSTLAVGLATGGLAVVDVAHANGRPPAVLGAYHDHPAPPQGELPNGWPLAGIGGGRVAGYVATEAIAVWDLQTGEMLDTVEPTRGGVLRVFKGRRRITAASLAPSGIKLAIAVGDRLYVLDQRTGWRGPTIEVPAGSIAAVQWSADEAHLLLTTTQAHVYGCSSAGGEVREVGADLLVADPMPSNPAVMAWCRSSRMGWLTHSHSSIDIDEAKSPPTPRIDAWWRSRNGMIVGHRDQPQCHAWAVARGIRATGRLSLLKGPGLGAPAREASSPSNRWVARRLGDGLEIYDTHDRTTPLRRIAPIDARHVLFLHDEIIATHGLGPGIEIRRWRTNELLVTLLSAPDGWAAIAPDGRFKAHGDLGGLAWHAVGLKRFDLGELDDAMPELRLPDDHVFVPELLEAPADHAS